MPFAFILLISVRKSMFPGMKKNVKGNVRIYDNKEEEYESYAQIDYVLENDLYGKCFTSDDSAFCKRCSEYCKDSETLRVLPCCDSFIHISCFENALIFGRCPVCEKLLKVIENEDDKFHGFRVEFSGIKETDDAIAKSMTFVGETMTSERYPFNKIQEFINDQSYYRFSEIMKFLEKQDKKIVLADKFEIAPLFLDSLILAGLYIFQQILLSFYQ